MAHLAAEHVVDHIAGLGEAPSCGDTDALEICRRLQEPPPEEGASFESLLEPYFSDWVHRTIGTAGPGYLAYVPGGGVYPAALADFIADATNRYTGVWAAAPVLVQLEANVLEWIRQWMAFPETTEGLLTTGGSMATFTAIVCARERHLGAEIRKGVIYVSSQTHHCVAKAARLAGIHPDRIRSLPVDEFFRMEIDALKEAVNQDRQSGLTPFLVVSSAGTTNTGAVDPLDGVADFAEREGLWHHCDAAYGGFFHMVDEFRPLLSGLSRADSLALDPHKGLFLPYGTGALLVSDGSALRDAHAATAGYLPPRAEDGFYDPSQVGPELSRDYRGLRVWLTIKLYGTARLRAAVAEKRCLALHAAGRLEKSPHIHLVAPPQLSLFAFHCTWPEATLEEENRATRDLVDRVTGRGRVMISGCDLDGRYLARVCVLSFRTRTAQMENAIADIEAEAESLAQQRSEA